MKLQKTEGLLTDRIWIQNGLDSSEKKSEETLEGIQSKW